MTAPRTPPIPAKARLTWRIARLRLDESGRRWIASGFKGERVAIIVLPEPSPTDADEDWFGRVEAAFEESAFNPMSGADEAPPRMAASDGVFLRGRSRVLASAAMRKP